MVFRLTDSLKSTRFTVVSVDRATGTLRVRGESEICTELACADAVVVTGEGSSPDLDQLNAGDVVTVAQADGRVQQIRVVRRVWEEYSGPEW
jgi:hypothetical protein